MLKKLLPLLLVCAMLVAISAGCGTGAAPEVSAASEEAAGEAAASVQAEPEEVTAPEGPAAAEEPSSTATGETSAEEPEPEETVAYQYDFPLDETVTFSYMNSFNPSLAGILDGWNAVSTVQEYEKMTNVHIEYLDLSPDVFFEQFNLRLTTDDLPDFIENAAMLYSGGEAAGVEDGYFANLLDYAEDMPCYMDALEDSEALKKTAYIDDSTIASFYQVQDPSNVNGCILRNDWLQELGMDEPVTYEDTHNVLLAMQSELGIEHPLEIPMFLDYQWNCFAGNFNTVGSFDIIGMSQQLFVMDGEVRYGMYTTEYEDYVTMLANWYQEGLIDPDFIGYEMVRDYQDKINSGKVGYYLNDLNNLEETQKTMADTGADWIGVRLPVQEPGRINHLTNYYEAVGVLGSVALSAKCENLPIAVQWMDYRRTDEIKDLFDFGLEGEAYTVNPDGSRQFTDLIVNNPNLTLQQALTIYTGSEGGSAERNLLLYSDRQKDAVTKWQTDVDGDWIYPSGISLNAEDSAEASALLGDIRTYISETCLKFVTGEIDLSEFQTFRDNLRQMGMDRVIEIYQDAYDAYVE